MIARSMDKMERYKRNKEKKSKKNQTYSIDLAYHTADPYGQNFRTRLCDWISKISIIMGSQY
jgi:Zn-finger domain-containing protein